MRRHWNYALYLMRHKWYVWQECRKVGAPLWNALIHDGSKFLPDEWLPFARCYYAPDGRSRFQPDGPFAVAQMRHRQRNKHHWQAWVYIDDCGAVEALPIPEAFRREMIADWRAAARSSGKTDLLGWYRGCRETMILHSETRSWIDRELGY
jgi:hypothetical protein